MEQQKSRLFYPELRQEFTETSGNSTICSYSHISDNDGPILVLIHGYPQSAYMYSSPCSLGVRLLTSIQVEICTLKNSNTDRV